MLHTAPTNYLYCFTWPRTIYTKQVDNSIQHQQQQFHFTDVSKQLSWPAVAHLKLIGVWALRIRRRSEKALVLVSPDISLRPQWQPQWTYGDNFIARIQLNWCITTDTYHSYNWHQDTCCWTCGHIPWTWWLSHWSWTPTVAMWSHGVNKCFEQRIALDFQLSQSVSHRLRLVGQSCL